MLTSLDAFERKDKRDKKRTRVEIIHKKREVIEEEQQCSFCQNAPPAVTVNLPAQQRLSQKRVAKPYCLVCYYTSSAIRQDPDKHVSVLSSSKGKYAPLEEHLPNMQELFSEAYLELQQELSRESTRAFQQQKKDPLGMFLGNGSNNSHLRMKKRTTMAKPLPPPQKPKGDTDDATAGGFLRSVPIPVRMLRVQQQQAELHAQQLARINSPTSLLSSSSAKRHTADRSAITEQVNVYKRRKSSRQSIWNLAMDPKMTQEMDLSKAATAAEASSGGGAEAHFRPPCSSCKSTDVRSFGNVTSRNQDMRKGETWGMKERGDDVVARFQCNQCGKMWNEEG
jgi:hypothetical protein